MLKSFEPIDLLALTGLSICIHPSVPAKNLQELIAYGKRQSRQAVLRLGRHRLDESARRRVVTRRSIKQPGIVHVPYKGGGPAITDLIGGQIPIVFANVTGQIIELHRTGKIRIVAVTTPDAAGRRARHPDRGRAGAGRHDLAELHRPVRARPERRRRSSTRSRRRARGVRGDAEYQKLLLASGQEPVRDCGPDKTLQFVKDELARWTPIIKSIGLKID